MLTKNKILFHIINIFIICIYQPTQAATICGYIYFWDERTDTDDDSKHIENYYQSNRLVHEAKILIYDRNGSCRDVGSCGESDDIYRGSFYTNTSGYFCATVTNGDNVYFINQMENIYGTVKKSDSTTYKVVSQILATNISGTQTVNWNLTCYDEADGLCNSQSQIDLDYPTTSNYVSILESVYDGAKYFDDNGVLNINSINYSNGQEFIAYFKNPTINGVTYCDTELGQCWNDHEFCVSESSSDDNHVIVHEMGHALHKRALNITTDPYFLSSCGASSWTGAGNGEKCVTSEGFANFVASAVYWEQDAVAPWWKSSSQLLEGNTTSGNGGNSLACASLNSSPEIMIANSSRFFWDLFDSTTVGTNENNGFNDDSNISFNSIVSEWDSFPSGTSNRQNKESGDNGRNIYDYEYYNSSVYSELDHNCLDNQTP